ncbi:hypothetical protein ACFY9F_37020 [Streptomyces sp. NPDC012421]|uniref:hypothetical protein n=1 Tax=Streptomyces sp. NPDC012421 TaxID=3364832 RepID=UPI0036E44652
MSKRMRRAAALKGVAGLLAVAGVTAGAGVAVAVDEVRFSTQELTTSQTAADRAPARE